MCMHRWVNENVSEWVSRVSEWASERVSEWASERVSGWVGEWVSEWGVSEQGKRKYEMRWWVSLCVCLYANDVCVWCVWEWVYVCVCLCMCVICCVRVVRACGHKGVCGCRCSCMRVHECMGCRSRSGIDQHHDLRRRSMQKQAMINSQAINLNELSW